MTDTYTIYTDAEQTKAKAKQAISKVLSKYPNWAFKWKPTTEQPLDLRQAPENWNWKNFPIHSTYHGIWICTRDQIKDGAPSGAAFTTPYITGWTGVTVTIFKKDSIQTIGLRILHELIHCLNLPADDMEEHLSEFLNLPGKTVFNLVRNTWLYPAIFRNIYEKLYYEWLLDQIEIEKRIT